MGASTVNMMALQPRSSTFFNRRSEATRVRELVLWREGLGRKRQGRTGSVLVEVDLENQVLVLGLRIDHFFQTATSVR